MNTRDGQLGAVASGNVMTLSVGQVIDGKYEIRRLIGQGAMGAVFEGWNSFIERRVAIKVMLASHDATMNARFQQEARAAGRIGNDHVLEVLDVGTFEGIPYIVSEFLDGEPLSERIKRHHRMEAPQVASIALQLLTGLGAAHRAGIIHRDLKPDNIFLLREKAGRKDFVKIIDFGISKFNADSNDGLKMTSTGVAMGTPYYMSPELARGEGQIDARSDLYTVGVIIYQALTGQVPFDGKSYNDLLFNIVLSTPKPLSELRPELDPHFVGIVQKSMARDPEGRYPSALDFALALDAWLKAHALDSPQAGATRELPVGLSATRLVSTPIPVAASGVETISGTLEASAEFLAPSLGLSDSFEPSTAPASAEFSLQFPSGEIARSRFSLPWGLLAIATAVAGLVVSGFFWWTQTTSSSATAPTTGTSAEVALGVASPPQEPNDETENHAAATGHESFHHQPAPDPTPTNPISDSDSSSPVKNSDNASTPHRPSSKKPKKPVQLRPSTKPAPSAQATQAPAASKPSPRRPEWGY